MAPRSRNRKRKKKASNPAKPPQTLLTEGWVCLDKGDARTALHTFRQLAKTGTPADFPIFCACRSRARELRARGLCQEAESLASHATSARARFEPADLAPADVLRFLSLTGPLDAVHVFVQLFGPVGDTNAPSGSLDASMARGTDMQTDAASKTRSADAVDATFAAQIVASQLLVGRCWDALHSLPADHPLRRDADLARQAMERMDAGDWAQAGKQLTRIPRRSPYASWRLLCKAMECLGTERDQEALRAVEQLPPHFPLPTLIAGVRQHLLAPNHADTRVDVTDGDSGGQRTDAEPASSGNDRHAVRLPPLDSPSCDRLCSMLGLNATATAANAFFEALHRSQPRSLQAAILPLIQTLLPEDPPTVRIALYELAAINTDPDDMPSRITGTLLEQVPARRTAAVQARLHILHQAYRQITFPGYEVVNYLKVIGGEFADADRQQLARGRVLLFLARWGRDHSVDPAHLDESERHILEQLVPDRRYHGQLLLAGLARQGLALDPGDRAGYELWLDLLQRHHASSRLMEEALQETAQRLEDDPAPWIKLARLHLERRNAYRQAQLALAQARALAPLDPELQDLECAAHLRAAVQSRRRRSFGKAAADLQIAAGMNRSGLNELLQAEEMALALCDPAGSSDLAIRTALGSLPPVRRIRTVAALALDLTQTAASGRSAAPAALTTARALLEEHTSTLDELDDASLPQLCAPLHDNAKWVFGSCDLTTVFRLWWDRLLQRTPPTQLLNVADAILAAGGIEPVHRQLEARYEQENNAGCTCPEWYVYIQVLRFSLGLPVRDQGLGPLLDDLPQHTIEHLRTTAQRLGACLPAKRPLTDILQDGDLETLALLLDAFVRYAGFPGDIELSNGVGPEGMPIYDHFDDALEDWLAEDEDPLPRDIPARRRRRSPSRAASRQSSRSTAAQQGDVEIPDIHIPSVHQEELLFPDLLDSPPADTPAHTQPPGHAAAKQVDPSPEAPPSHAVEVDSGSESGVPCIPAGKDAGIYEDADTWGDTDGGPDPVSSAEFIIDSIGMRGAPLKIIRDASSRMQSDPESAEMIELLRTMCEPFRDALSPEAEALLFPRSPKSRHKTKRKRQRS